MMRRLFRFVCMPMALVFLGASVLFSAWLNGAHIPVASGKTYVKITKTTGYASFNGEPTGLLFILVDGNDFRPGVDGKRGDATHLIGINTQTKQGTILDIPRDTEVPIPGHGNDKINSANAYGGAALAAQTVGNLVGVSVPYVVQADFEQFVSLINEMGGIEINVPASMHDHYSGSDFSPGVQKLNGDQALAFSRDRHTFAQGDITRTENQGAVLLATLTALRKQNPGIADQMKDLAILGRHTDMQGLGLRDAYRLLRLAMNVEPSNIKNVTIPVANSGHGTNLAPTAAAASLFADFRDDATLQSH